MGFNDDALALLGSIMPEFKELSEKNKASRKEYYRLASSKCNPDLVSVESTDEYLARRSSEFMALLEA